MVITIVVVATENVWMSALEQQRSKTLETENMSSELDLKDWVAGSGLGQAHLCCTGIDPWAVTPCTSSCFLHPFQIDHGVHSEMYF